MSKVTPEAIPDEKLTIAWKPWLGLVFALLVFFGAQILAGVLTSIYPALKHWTPSHTDNWLNNAVVAQFVFVLLAESLIVGAIYLFLKRRKLSLKAIGLKRPKPSDPLYALAVAPVYFGIFEVAVVIIKFFVPGLNIDQQQQIGFSSHTVHGLVPMAMTFISLVILPPLAEEIMVRGFIYTSLRGAMKIVPAALLTSLLFASAHLPEGGAAGPLYIAAIDTFILSLALIYLREKTGNLWASITLHALKNGVAFVAIFVVHAH